MQTTLNLPDQLYRKSLALADARGATLEEVLVEALSKTLGGESVGESDLLPVIRSRRPGTLDLMQFDFDDLLT